MIEYFRLHPEMMALALLVVVVGACFIAMLWNATGKSGDWADERDYGGGDFGVDHISLPDVHPFPMETLDVDLALPFSSPDTVPDVMPFPMEATSVLVNPVSLPAPEAQAMPFDYEGKPAVAEAMPHEAAMPFDYDAVRRTNDGEVYMGGATATEDAPDIQVVRLKDQVKQLTAKLAEMAGVEKFMADWPAVQADIAKQKGGVILNPGQMDVRTVYAERDAALAALADMTKRKDGAYEERNRVVAALATYAPATKWPTAIEGWDAEWNNCVYIELPTGQVSWHYNDSQKDLFSHVKRKKTAWDGHTTEEKYRRLRKFTRDYE